MRKLIYLFISFYYTSSPIISIFTQGVTYSFANRRNISKEIKRSRIFKESQTQFFGGCINRNKCHKKYLCNDNCNELCKKCMTLNCYRTCPDFTVKTCHITKKFPHICNGCETKTTCKLNKYRYSAKHAEASYRDNLETSRSGIN